MAVPAGSEGLTRKSTADWAADTKTYLQGERLLDIDTGEQRVSSGGTYEQAWKSIPSSYRATIVQVGTSAPTATIHHNSLGGVPTFAYVGPGQYEILGSGLFPAGKTSYWLAQPVDPNNGFEGQVSFGSDDVLNYATYSSGVASDDATPSGQILFIIVDP